MLPAGGGGGGGGAGGGGGGGGGGGTTAIGSGVDGRDVAPSPPQPASPSANVQTERTKAVLRCMAFIRTLRLTVSASWGILTSLGRQSFRFAEEIALGYGRLMLPPALRH